MVSKNRLRFCVELRVADELVGATSWRTEIDERLILVLGLEEVALGGHGLGSSIGRNEQVLVRVVALLQGQHSFVGLQLVVILEFVLGYKLVESPVGIEIDATVVARRLEREMHEHVFGCAVVLKVVAVADIEGSVGIFVVDV